MHNSIAYFSGVSQRDAQTRLKESDIPDVNFDGSKRKSTFWLSLVAPILLAATLLVWMLGSNGPLTKGVNIGIAGGAVLVLVCVFISTFPTQASSRFVTDTLKRPVHFIPTVASIVSVLALTLISVTQTVMFEAYHLTAVASGNFAAIFLVLTITTNGRYAMNYIAMTQRLLVVMLCWAGSFIVQDQTLLAVGLTAVAVDLLWRIQSRWTPVLALSRLVAANPMSK